MMMIIPITSKRKMIITRNKHSKSKVNRITNKVELYRDLLTKNDINGN